MAVTAQNIVTEVQFDFPDRSDTELLADLQDVYDELSFDFKLNPGTQSVSTITAGTAGYALSAGTTRVYQARYHTSSTSYTVLDMVHVDWLDAYQSQWRGASDGTPRYCYVELGTIYLHPAPDTSTSGGYPTLDVDTTTNATLVLATALPAGLASYKVFSEGVKALSALRTSDGRYPEYKARYEAEKDRLARQTHRFGVHFHPTLSVETSSTGRV